MVLVRSRVSVLTFVVGFVLVLVACLFVLHTDLFQRNPVLATWGITFDLTITVSALYYFCLVRTNRVPAISILAVFLVGFRLLGLLLPPSSRTQIQPLVWLMAPLELIAIVFMIYRVRQFLVAQKQLSSTSADPWESFANALRQTYGDNPVMGTVLSELEVLYFAFIARPLLSLETSDTLSVTVHKKTSWCTMLWVIGFLVLVEGSVVHYLLHRWNPVAAWVWTGLDLYTLLWLRADFQAIRLRPLRLTPSHLAIRFGLRWQGTIPLSEIHSVHSWSSKLREPKKSEYLRLTLLTEPEFILKLRTPIEFRGPIGIRKRVRFVGIHADDPALLTALQKAMAS